MTIAFIVLTFVMLSRLHLAYDVKKILTDVNGEHRFVGDLGGWDGKETRDRPNVAGDIVSSEAEFLERFVRA